MTGEDIFLLVGALVGGMALFLFGMHVMSEALRAAAGNRLRTILSNATHNRFYGITLGTLLGFIAHSGPALVMLIGFINAGLMTLAEAIPPVLGANLGTSLNMQLISFDLGRYSLAAIGLGFLIHWIVPKPEIKQMGRALLGFGLLFLGMMTVGEAIKPHRDLIAEFLRHVHGNTLAGMVRGVLISTLVTAAVQSSGAVIGMCFALVTAGVFTDLAQIYPIILGAHVGTCITALLCAIGTNIDARRTAAAHLLFNILTVILAMAGAPILLPLLARTSPSLLHQAANVHTGVMLLGVVVFLPVARLFSRLVVLVAPSRRPPPQPSFLDPKLIEFPEKAIYAGISELQRVTRICARSFRLTIDVLFNPKRNDVQAIKLNENVVDEIKKAMKDYLRRLARRSLSRRQAILIQHLNRCMADIERIGDHIDELCDISVRRKKNTEARFNRDTLELLVSLYESAEKVVHLVIESLNPDNEDFQGMAQAIFNARDEYVEKSLNAKAIFTEKIANHEFPPIVGMFFSEYVAAYDRIVKHAKTVALAEKQPYFWIKRKKLEKMVEEAPEYKPPPLTDPHDFLDRLHAEDL